MKTLSEMTPYELDELMFLCPREQEALEDFVDVLVLHTQTDNDTAILAKRITHFSGRASAALAAMLMVRMRAKNSDFEWWLLTDLVALATAATVMTPATFIVEFEIDREAFERGDPNALIDVHDALYRLAVKVARGLTRGAVEDHNGEGIGTFGVKS